MYIIVDSGSTKAAWCLASDGKPLQTIVTQGINPVYATDGQLSAIIADEVKPQLAGATIDRVWFYGAGCIDHKQNDTMADIIGKSLSAGDVSVATDMLGAARALLKDRRGIACILGTGTNSCIYNGTEIENSVRSGGFILGDEGSGAAIGKSLISDYVKNRMPQHIYDRLTEEYGLSYFEIVQRVYRGEYPGRWLAGFTIFLSRFRNDEYVHELLLRNFSALFERNIKQYPEHKTMPVNFIGSIACHFRTELEEAAAAAEVTIGAVSKNPIDGLVEYHNIKP